MSTHHPYETSHYQSGPTGNVDMTGGRTYTERPIPAPRSTWVSYGNQQEQVRYSAPGTHGTRQVLNSPFPPTTNDMRGNPDLHYASSSPGDMLGIFLVFGAILALMATCILIVVGTVLSIVWGAIKLVLRGLSAITGIGRNR